VILAIPVRLVLWKVWAICFVGEEPELQPLPGVRCHEGLKAWANRRTFLEL
jgi:hypothetical protein